jgi:choline dehydrogenase-like flavoprotein
VILDVSTVGRDLHLTADACVVGSGAGGSVAAARLQRAGLSTVVLEEGAYVTSRAMNQREEDMYVRLYRQRGTQPTADFAVLVSQGRVLGGSTIVGNCVCMRPPRQILDAWRDQHRVAELDFEALFPHVERIEREIGVAEIADDGLNENNRGLRRGSERLGYRGRILHHNRRECLGCGYCSIGCAYERKGDALATHLGEASRRL